MQGLTKSMVLWATHKGYSSRMMKYLECCREMKREPKDDDLLMYLYGWSDGVVAELQRQIKRG
jgi:hypothetical protein